MKTTVRLMFITSIAVALAAGVSLAGETEDQAVEAAEIYQGDFLSGFTLRDSPGFDDWQSLEAQALRREMGGALERLSEVRAIRGDVVGSIRGCGARARGSLGSRGARGAARVRL